MRSLTSGVCRVDPFGGEFGEPAFDEVHPARVGRREVQREAGVADQPALHRRGSCGLTRCRAPHFLEPASRLAAPAMRNEEPTPTGSTRRSSPLGTPEWQADRTHSRTSLNPRPAVRIVLTSSRRRQSVVTTPAGCTGWRRRGRQSGAPHAGSDRLRADRWSMLLAVCRHAGVARHFHGAAQLRSTERQVGARQLHRTKRAGGTLARATSAAPRVRLGNRGIVFVGDAVTTSGSSAAGPKATKRPTSAHPDRSDVTTMAADFREDNGCPRSVWGLADLPRSVQERALPGSRLA